MKTKLFILLMLIASPAFSQNCSPKVTVNCDSTLTVMHTPKPGFPIPYAWAVQFSGLNAPANVMVSPDIVTGGVAYITTTSISPSFSQYSVTISPVDINNVGVGYPCNSTSIVWSAYDAATNSYIGVPALIGYTYQYGTTAFQSLVCTSQSSASFLPTRSKKKK